MENGISRRSRKASSADYSAEEKNVVRVVGQYLQNLGLNETANVLTRESGCEIESEFVIQLRNAIQEQNFTLSLELINEAPNYLTPKKIDECKAIIKEQQFYSLIRKGSVHEALWLIRENFFEEGTDSSKRENYMMRMFMNADELIRDKRDLYSTADRRSVLIRKLQTVFPVGQILSPNRLKGLLNQAYFYQLTECRKHLQTKDFKEMPAEHLLVDHKCSVDSDYEFENDEQHLENVRQLHPPNVLTYHVIKDRIQVRCAEFSPCGNFLATASRLCNLMTFKIDPQTFQSKLWARIGLIDETNMVTNLSWSSDGQYLAVCAKESATATELTVFDVNKVGRRRIKYQPSGSFTVCAFMKCKKSILACGNDEGSLQIFIMHKNRSPELIAQLDGVRPIDLYGMKDGNSVLMADGHKRVRIYRFRAGNRDEILFTENFHITSVTVHPNERYVAVSTKQCIRLWDIQTKTPVRCFSGAKQGDFIIRSAFGGPKNAFLATGTTDNQVVFWNVDKNLPVLRIQNHNKMVNCVSWNPKNPRMLASASDDMTIVLTYFPETDDEKSSGRPQHIVGEPEYQCEPLLPCSIIVWDTRTNEWTTGRLSNGEDTEHQEWPIYSHTMEFNENNIEPIVINESDLPTSAQNQSEMQHETSTTSHSTVHQDDSSLYIVDIQDTGIQTRRQSTDDIIKTNGYQESSHPEHSIGTIISMMEDGSSNTVQSNNSLDDSMILETFESKSNAILLPRPDTNCQDIASLKKWRASLTARKARFKVEADARREQFHQKYKHIRINRSRMTEPLESLVTVDEYEKPLPEMFQYSTPSPPKIPKKSEPVPCETTLLLYTPLPFLDHDFI